MDLDSSPPALHQQAIQAALSAKWDEALLLNQQIIASDPNNVDALNRTARAYFELGQLKKSKDHFEKSLQIDPYNQIAAKFIKRISLLKEGSLKLTNHNGHGVINPDLFIKEPGKSKLVNLLKLAEPQKLSVLCSGSQVNLMVKNHSISVTDLDGEYLGILPDDLSHRLIRFIRGGNKYQAYIKSIASNAVSILIKELYRSPRFKNQPSFTEIATFTYSSDHINLVDESDTGAEGDPEEEEVI